MLPARLPTRHLREARFIAPEPLNVSPQLVGLPLASPARRAWAMLIDVCVVGLLSGVSGFWLLGGLALVVLQLRSKKGGLTRRRQIVGWVAVALLGALAITEFIDSREGAQRAHPTGVGAAQRAAEAAEAAADSDEDRKTAAEVARAIGLAASAVAAAASGASSPHAMAAAVGDNPELLRARIADLESQLQEARRPRTLRQQLSHLMDDIGLGLGWGIVYFSLLPAYWSGQTVGKKLLRLRVVELTGAPMTVMRSLRRYGGYAAGMATGGVGFLQMLWDPNRQAVQDRTAHTAVIDLRQQHGAAAPAYTAPTTGGTES